MTTVPNGASCQLLKLDVELPTKGGKRGWVHFFQIKSSPQFRCFSNGKKKEKKKDDLTPRRYGDISFYLQLFGLVKICNSPGEI